MGQMTELNLVILDSLDKVKDFAGKVFTDTH